jgi:hypothetical protein
MEIARLMEMAVRSMETAETAMETDGYGSGGTSPSRQGAGTETSIPQNLSSMAAVLRNYSGKNADFPRVFYPRLYIGKGASSGGCQGTLTMGGRGQGLGHALLLCGRPLAPSGSLSVFGTLPRKIRLLELVSSNSKNISYVTFLKHKNSRKQGTSTMASCQ